MHRYRETKLRCVESYIKILDLLDLTGALPKQIWIMKQLSKRIGTIVNDDASGPVNKIFERTFKQIGDLKTKHGQIKDVDELKKVRENWVEDTERIKRCVTKMTDRYRQEEFYTPIRVRREFGNNADDSPDSVESQESVDSDLEVLQKENTPPSRRPSSPKISPRIIYKPQKLARKD